MGSDRVAATPQSRISSGVVQAFKRSTGRGPTRAQTTISENLIVVTMRDLLTELERNLVAREGGDGGEGILRLRFEVQQSMRDELIALVETETGREVDAFMSANHIDPDMAVEIFVLSPEATLVA